MAAAEDEGGPLLRALIRELIQAALAGLASWWRFRRYRFTARIVSTRPRKGHPIMRIAFPKNLIPTVQFAVTAGGQPSKLDGPATVEMIDAGVAVVPKSESGLEQEFDPGPDVEVGAIFRGKIMGDARLGDAGPDGGRREISTEFELEILDTEADGFAPVITGFRTRE